VGSRLRGRIRRVRVGVVGCFSQREEPPTRICGKTKVVVLKHILVVPVAFVRVSCLAILGYKISTKGVNDCVNDDYVLHVLNDLPGLISLWVISEINLFFLGAIITEVTFLMRCTLRLICALMIVAYFLAFLSHHVLDAATQKSGLAAIFWVFVVFQGFLVFQGVVVTSLFGHLFVSRTLKKDSTFAQVKSSAGLVRSSLAQVDIAKCCGLFLVLSCGRVGILIWLKTDGFGFLKAPAVELEWPLKVNLGSIAYTAMYYLCLEILPAVSFVWLIQQRA
jgi:hypothetical protein